MPEFYKKQRFLYPVYVLAFLTFLLITILVYFHWMTGMISFVVFCIVFFFVIKFELAFQRSVEKYTNDTITRVKKVSNEAFNQMPIGILLYNKDYGIDWANPYLSSCLGQHALAGWHLYDLSEALLLFTKGETANDIVSLNNRKFRVFARKEEKLIYFFDVTEQTEIEKMYEDQRTVLAVIYLDNYDEVTQGLDDQLRTNITSHVTSLLNEWAVKHGAYLKRASSERYFVVLNESILTQMEKGKFDILDQVREETSKRNIPLTLSIGVGSGDLSLVELGSMAQSGLDLALGRGGDQVAIKQATGKVKFYGGKTNPVEKRTRVRARVISHALKDLVLESSNIIIMGHRAPDMDAIGAAIGILKVTQLNEREGYIVLDENDSDKGIKRLMDEVKQHEELWSRFITPQQALEFANDDSLLVVVDTHKPSMVMEKRLLDKIENVVVIDHHRRGEDFIEDPLLVYMEPYASSTAELVTELLEYQPKRLKMNMLEATALLAGIIVDTKSFTFRTGARTFDAASYLRSHGADTILVQKLLKEDMAHYLQIAKTIRNAYIYKNGIAIAKVDGDGVYDQVLIAQSADTLLTMTGVIASFVIAQRGEKVIGISGRSLGEVNVQLIMENLGGGGHLTNAATQIQDISIDEAEANLKSIINEYLEGGTQS
ncbi:c-di-AMP phosphodiesterase, consists of a GGDEF-like and DHH domains [Bacillus sp. 491mf]|uniref:DHH family phosphoesterase n=1 Tax=unclassified Bacillus (in: firmicutes) TaxID=185979 RepID=UPI000554F035|nr:MULTISPECIES: DHH family phosphoesterase [unclassified Bacillus (in: firmicutes)]SFD15334.1 c-di-AMP phosphodiesterase, consists of a GGDEF-like and DHH domains [Bacillus sp. 491mf]